ncbi:MAG: sigma-70 family RNA polymerase sigma factor, partial [Bdellovibrionales bacterium]|nr:sigma-70 family RNA polymerase sigma factor [Bdellovibrionales bacterium]
HRRWIKRLRNFLGTRPEPHEPAPQSELALTLQKLIRQLPTQQRTVFILRHLHGFSTRETSELLGVTEGTIKTQLKRAVDKLRHSLDVNDSLRKDVYELESKEEDCEEAARLTTRA